MIQELNIRRTLLFTLIVFVYTYGNCQFEKIATNTSATLQDLSVIRKNVLVSGFYDYLGRSKNQGKNLSILSVPGATGSVIRCQRLDTNNIFLLSYSPSQTQLYRSYDGGDSWIQRSVSAGAFSHYFGFFDTLTGLRTDGPFLEKTLNGGITWTNVTCPFFVGTTAIKTFGDSLVCLGGVDASGRGLVLSKNRGKTWPNGWGILGHNVEITGFSFVSNDTILAVGTGGIFVYTVDGGANWIDTSEPPIYDYYDAACLKSNECYLVGGNSEGYGVIAKTTDFGKTWSSLNTGFKTTLQNVEIINDSIALLAGTNGILLRWNYKTSVFTGVDEGVLADHDISLFPNPANELVTITVDFNKLGACYTTLRNQLGQKLRQTQITGANSTIDLAGLHEGIYYVEVGSKEFFKVFKIIKE